MFNVVENSLFWIVFRNFFVFLGGGEMKGVLSGGGLSVINIECLVGVRILW